MAATVRAPEDLYGLGLEEFTPARDALAKELMAAGHQEDAAAVKALRKPSVAAWALNRAAREHPEAVAGLRSVGADLRTAQDEALSGDAGRLREAGRALSDEIDRFAALAVDALQSAGRPASRAQQEKFASTLRTAAIDEAAGEALAQGVLADDLDATGFSLLGSLSGDLNLAPRSKPRPAKADKEAVEAVESARRELRRCEAEADLAATRAKRHAERAESAAKRAAEAQRDADEARSAAEEAAGEAESARRLADEAAETLGAAESTIP